MPGSSSRADRGAGRSLFIRPPLSERADAHAGAHIERRCYTGGRATTRPVRDEARTRRSARHRRVRGSERVFATIGAAMLPASFANAIARASILGVAIAALTGCGTDGRSPPTIELAECRLPK